MFRYSTTFIFLCVLATAIRGQSFATADSLFDAHDYKLAAVEYERCVFLSQSRSATHTALVRKAQCYKAMGEYGHAATTLERCAREYDDYGQLALCCYLNADFEGALSACEHCRMLKGGLDEDLLLLRVLALNGLQRYDSAHVAALQWSRRHLEASGEDLSPWVDSVYACLPRLKNENVAWYLSFVPGLGHLYAGKYGMGAAAFVLNAAVLGFGVWQVLEKYYLTAYLGGAGLLGTLYPGTMRSAAYYVRQYNYLRTTQFNDAFRLALPTFTAR